MVVRERGRPRSSRNSDACPRSSVALIQLVGALVGMARIYARHYVSSLPAHSRIATVQLAAGERIEAHFEVRAPAPVAVVATAGQPVRVFDLSGLPAPPPPPTALAASALQGDAATGFMDCSPAVCFVAGNLGTYALAP